MLVVGYVGWGPQLHLTHLTADEQYTHISMWCLCPRRCSSVVIWNGWMPSPIICFPTTRCWRLTRTRWAKQATRVSNYGELDVFAKALDDGSLAVGLVNRSAGTARVTARWADLKITGKQNVRDLWRQKRSWHI